jgi:hypothetical protein
MVLESKVQFFHLALAVLQTPGEVASTFFAGQAASGDTRAASLLVETGPD